MRRRAFIEHCVLWTAASGFSAVPQEGSPSSIRRLSHEKSFTIYHPGLTPAYAVPTGEVVLVECRHGLPGLVTRDGRFTEPKPGDAVNPGTGPIFVEGIAPGDALAIDLLEIKTADWGYSGGRIFDLADGFAIVDGSLKLPLQPMIGQIGIAPAKGAMDTRAPSDTGGNMDCKEVRAGSTLVFTAQVKGGMVGLGDAHALQGDGEIGGQGIECDAEALVRFRKLPGKLSDRPVIVRSEFIATVGAAKDLADAAWQATEDMIRLLAKTTGRTEKDARMLVNLLGSLRINQIVDPTKGARMEVPAWLFGLAPFGKQP